MAARYRKLWLLALIGLCGGCEKRSPIQDATLFAPCYEGTGICLDDYALTDEQRKLLESDTCSSELRCVPRNIAAGKQLLSCESLADVEGRCLSVHLPMVESQRDQLPQSYCDFDERCVPCFDLLSGEATGACGLPGDRPRKAPRVLEACCSDVGRCVPETLVASEQRELLGRDNCDDRSMCVPMEVLDEQAPPRCTAVGGSEGRCLPSCLPLIASQIDQLESEGCEESQRCAPCSDPITGEATGACSLPGDSGPEKPAAAAQPCCGDKGVCLPSQLIDDADSELLGRERCAEEQLCVPRNIVDREAARSCASVGGAEGRCLPSCLPSVANKLDKLPQGFCDANERCVPCSDPFSGEDTGACSLPGDGGPTSLALRFARCCNDAGYCLPESEVEAEQRQSLARDGCESAQLCVPQQVIDRSAPAACSSISDVEGRCLPDCLSLVAAEEGRLPRASCGEHERCAPCFDPLSGEATGACNLPGDSGPREDAHTFQVCCGGKGHCLPSEFVPETQREGLAQDDCQAAQLCAPQTSTSGAAAKSCSSVSGAEGRCLPSCLPLVAAQPGLPRSFCEEQERCAPCFDPFTGADTGACRLPGDPGPTAPAVRLTSCCDDAGYCLPTDQVPESQRAQLQQSECAEAELCTPQKFIQSVAAQSCSSIAGSEGRCMPTCLPLVASQLDQLPVSSCGADERCAPCFDPFAGQATGACSGPGDPGPTKPPQTFADCCLLEDAARGRCVPPELIPSEKRSLLSVDICEQGELCLPSGLTPPKTSLPACSAAQTGAGACVPACLLDSSQFATTDQATCEAWERCFPCSVAGKPTGVCD